ncbi:MAG: restriction endonuclease [Tissierellia bacterium]|nr:restriction endonuclease [Tissierellia bacterium]
MKDSYVAFLRKDNSAIHRNPSTVNRLVEILYEMGLDDILYEITQPKETNRQIGPLFKSWIDGRALGCKITTSHEEILNSNDNIVLNTSDKNMKDFARKYLGYQRDKGLDFIAKFNGKYVIGEAKFLTDYGGHQNSQFNDAINTMTSKFLTDKEVIPIAILDGVLYLKNDCKMYREITTKYAEDNILSALLLREFLYSL